MRLSLVHFSFLLLAVSLSLPASQAAEGLDRAGSWNKAGQGAPDLAAARAKVQKNPKDADALNDLGFALRQNEQFAEAEKCLKQALELKPEMGTAHANLSVVYYDQKKYSEALAEAQKAVKTNANQPIFRVVLGNALSKTGDLKGAAQEYKVAIHLKPKYENAHFNLGRVLNEDGQVTEAKYSLAKALELDPDDDRAVELLDKLEKSGADPAAVGGAGGAGKK